MHTNPISLKYIMKRLGLVKCNDHRPPILPASPELEKRLDEVLKGAGLL
jgi:4-hydroxy-tetrahydrodipicolinate synthase